MQRALYHLRQCKGDLADGINVELLHFFSFRELHSTVSSAMLCEIVVRGFGLWIVPILISCRYTFETNSPSCARIRWSQGFSRSSHLARSPFLFAQIG